MERWDIREIGRDPNIGGGGGEGAGVKELEGGGEGRIYVEIERHWTKTEISLRFRGPSSPKSNPRRRWSDQNRFSS